MKNVLKTLLALSLACLMLVSLVSCDKSGSIKKAFEKEGYTVTVVNADNENIQTLLSLLLNEEQVKEVSKYELIYCQPEGLVNVLNNALVIKFSDSSAMKEFLGEDSYKNASENGIVNGNCLILTAGSGAKEIFKKA